MAEQIFFNEGGVTVTSARFIVPSQTYAMSGVISVKSLQRDPSRKGMILLVALGLVAMLAIILIGSLVLGLCIGLLVISGGVTWGVVRKPLYAIVLHSASGEAEAFASADATFIARIIHALNEAIIARG